MGQSPLGGAQKLPVPSYEPSIMAKPIEQSKSDSRATSSTAATNADRRSDYLSRFEGSSPRNRRSGGCADLCTLLDVNGDGSVECSEVLRAICMVDPIIQEAGRQGHVCVQEGSGYLNVIHRRDDAQVRFTGEPSFLEVPPEFEGISYDWAAPSGSQPPPPQDQHERLQSCMKAFIQSMLVGVLVRLRLDPEEAPYGDSGGQGIDAAIILSQDLTNLCISAGSAEHSVPVKAIRSVRPPDKGSDRDKCADFRLAGDRFVRFKFDLQAQAKFFGTCMRLLVKAARSNMATPSATPPRSVSNLRAC